MIRTIGQRDRHSDDPGQVRLGLGGAPEFLLHSAVIVRGLETDPGEVHALGGVADRLPPLVPIVDLAELQLQVTKTRAATIAKVLVYKQLQNCPIFS